MKLRIGNDGESALTVVLEPWATEFEVAVSDFIEFRIVGPASSEAYWSTERGTNDVLTIWAEGIEGEAGVVHAYDSDGRSLD